jgi:regulator of protease activity HflC (stomatin/prohibitin superfamily)
MIRERQRSAITGWLMLPVLVVLAAGGLRFLFLALQARTIVGALAAMLLVVATVICFGGFFVVNPNEGRVLQLFGAYNGAVREPGLRWASPFYTKKHVSLRVRNFESGKLKVNDFDGNPVEIAAVVVWRVVDTAEAVFEVDNFEIAAVMLRRQQAAAIIAARTRIVEGAVGMVDTALERLSKSSHVQLDEERKAAMMSNLLVVLCADREARPVVNTGTLYQ